MFLTVTRRVCQNTVLHLECPLDQLLNVYDIWMGVAEDQMCSPSGGYGNPTVCKATETSELNNVVNVGELCQNQTLCEFSFPDGQQAAGRTSDGADATCDVYVLSVTYTCVSKYCIEINKTLRLLSLLAVTANSDKVIYGIIPNALYQH